jgi:hypothetical protein
MSTTRAMHWPADANGPRIAMKAATLAAIVMAIFVPAPLKAQNDEYVVYSSYVKKGNTNIGYCSIARADTPVQGKIMDRKKTRQLVCEMLVKRLRMGAAYPDSPGSCQGYSLGAANECLMDGVNLKKIMSRY